MNHFQGHVQVQRQVINDRHQQIRREFGATRTVRSVRDQVRRRDRARPGPIR